MKHKSIIFAGLALGILCIGGSAICCPALSTLHRNAEGGGLSDTSDQNAPKIIQSNVLTKFSLEFLEDGSRAIGSRHAEHFPVGRYRLQAERRGDLAHFTLFCDRYGTVTPLTIAKDLPSDALDGLHALMLAHGLPAINGSSRRNTALGTFIQLDALYDTGETIYVYAEGGSSTVPRGWCGTDVFLEFFLGQLGAEKKLTVPLYSFDYAESNGETGYLYRLALKADSVQGSGRAIFYRCFQETNERAPVEKNFFVPREKLEELERLILSYDMGSWSMLPQREEPDPKEDFCSIAINYSGAKKADCIDSDQALPPEAGDAFLAVKSFLEELEESGQSQSSAPQAQ